ncbi:hypothetical protein DsansV1_C36g0232351 [Dioscorea sansibarensis]
MHELCLLMIVIWNLWSMHLKYKKSTVCPLLWMKQLYTIRLWGKEKKVGVYGVGS